MFKQSNFTDDITSGEDKVKDPTKSPEAQQTTSAPTKMRKRDYLKKKLKITDGSGSTASESKHAANDKK